MASWTDQIPQFNKYVQQLPVEAMVQVGMEKQKRYDEGLQKIQSQIENVAGLDVYKSAHKEYLQSKLNELGNNLRGVAAGDFSNFQLVNSVGGMVNQVIKDPVVKNAYQSTQFLRKQQERMEEAKKNGKSSPENEWWFANEVNSWENDSDLLKPFSGEYFEYRDIDKKLRDVASKIKEVEQSVDIPYQRNADGSVKTDANGNPLVDDAMLRIKVKGTPAEKILNNFYSSLDKNDERQLMITGNYHYRNATKATFQKDIIDTYTAQKKDLENQVAKWAVDLKNNDKLSASEKAQIEAAINLANQKLTDGFFEKEATRKVSEIDNSDITDFRYRLYTQKYLTGLAQDLSNQSYTQEILSNPYAQMNMEKKKLEFQVQRARQEHQEFLMNYGLNAERLNFEKFKWQKEQIDKDAEKKALEPIVDYGGLGTDAKMPTLGDLDKSIEDTKNTISTLNSDFGNLLFPSLKGPARQKALDDLVNQYITNPTSIKDNNQRDYVEQIRSLQIEQARKNALYSAAVEHTSIFNNKIKESFRNISGINFSNGQEMFSAEDLYVANSKVSEFLKVSGTDKFGIKPSVSFNYNGYINSLPVRLKNLAIALAKHNSGQPLTSVEKLIVKRAEEIGNTYRPVVNQIYKDKLVAESKFLAQRMPEVQTTFGTLNMDDKITKQRVENLIGNATRKFNELGTLDVENRSDFDPSTLMDWTTGKGSGELKYVAEKNYDGSGKLIVYKGSEKQVIPLSPSDLSSYFPNVAKTSFMTPIKFQVLSSPSKTTNAVKVGDPVNAYMSGFEIPGISTSKYASVTRLDFEGHPKNNGGPDDKFQIRMYVFDNGVWKNDIINQQGYVGAAGAEEILNNIGPATVIDLLRKK